MVLRVLGWIAARMGARVSLVLLLLIVTLGSLMTGLQRMVLLALSAIFVAPLALAWALYHTADGQPQGGLQHGELLLPLHRLESLSLTNVDGKPLDTVIFNGRWTLLYHSDHCAADCQQLLSMLQRVRLAQGHSMAQVQRVLVLAALPSANEIAHLVVGAHDLRVASASRWPLESGYVYLLDPQGNLVMRYPPGFEPRGLLKDLQRLLHVAGAE